MALAHIDEQTLTVFRMGIARFGISCGSIFTAAGARRGCGDGVVRAPKAHHQHFLATFATLQERTQIRILALFCPSHECDHRLPVEREHQWLAPPPVGIVTLAPDQSVHFQCPHGLTTSPPILTWSRSLTPTARTMTTGSGLSSTS